MTGSSAQASTVTGGTAVGRYRICSKLAAGGMASIYLSRMEGPYGFERLVALKLIHPHLALKKNFIEMFLDEARLASRITHPNVTSVLDFGQHGDTYFLAMDYIFGETLVDTCRQLIPRPDLLASERWHACAARIIADAAEGLHAAHELRDESGNLLHVVHRDVSPDNIFVTYDGVVKVVDFGVARAEGQIHQTTVGTIKGKYAYMAPEMLKPDTTIDRRADVWALGVVLWELLTCLRLFKRDSEPATLIAVNADPVDPPSEHAPTVPVELDAIVMRALQRDPDLRYSNARELSRDLKRFVAERAELIDTPEIGELMRDLHPDELMLKRALMERARALTWKESSSQILVAQSSNASLLRPATTGEHTLVPDSGAHAHAPGRNSAAMRQMPISIGSGPYQVPPRRRRRGVIAAVSIVLAAAAAAAITVAVVRGQKQAPAADGPMAALVPGATAGTPQARPVPANPDPDPAGATAADAGAPTDEPGGATGSDAGATGDADDMTFAPDAVGKPAPSQPLRRTPTSRRPRPRAGSKTAGGQTEDTPPASRDVDDTGDKRQGGDDPPKTNPGGAVASVLDAVKPAPINPGRPPEAAKPPPKPPVLDANADVRAVTSRGSLARSKVQRAIDRVSGEFRGCYKSAATKAKRDASSRVRVSFTIDEQGFSRDIRASGGKLPGLDDCVSKVARKIRSRQPPDVGNVKVTFEVAFTPRT